MSQQDQPLMLPDRKKAVCSRCAGERNCAIHGHYQERGGDEHTDWLTEWYILQCLGCDYVFSQTVSTNSEDYESYYERDGSAGTSYNETIDYWPALSKRAKPDWFTPFGFERDENGHLYDSLLELYGALDGGLFMLAGIGIRTTIDVASGLLGVDERKTFREKLDALVHGGLIGKLDRERLETLVEAGSASAHRGWKPSLGDFEGMMAILEHFLHEALVAPEQKRKLDAQANAIRAKVPTRPQLTKPGLSPLSPASPSPASSPSP